MDAESERLWTAFVQAEQSYYEALAALSRTDLEAVLREALSQLPWRRAALAVLSGSDTRIRANLLPQLFQLSLVSHSLLAEVRRCIMRIPRAVLDEEIPRLVATLISDPSSDYEAYRRTAELLRTLGMRPTLTALVSAAALSSDSDIREVAEDFLSP